MTFDAAKPNTSQTIGDVITSALANLNDLNSRDVAHQADIAAAHGIDALITGKADYVAHKANTADAHGIGTIAAQAAAAQAEITTARGSCAALDTRLSVALHADGGIKLSSIASKWLDNGDVPTFLTGTTFSVPGDRTLVYLAGAILRCTVSASYVYAAIASRSSGAGVTTVVLDPLYPVLSSGLSKIEIALIAWDNAVAAAATENAAGIVDLQGQITGIATLGSMAGDPTGAELAAGKVRAWKNTTSGAVKLWANDGGTLKSVALT